MATNRANEWATRRAAAEAAFKTIDAQALQWKSADGRLSVTVLPNGDLEIVANGATLTPSDALAVGHFLVESYEEPREARV